MITFCRDALRTMAAPCSAQAGNLSRRMDNQLSRGERLGLWVHLRGCTACRAFARQLDRLRALARADAPAAPQVMPAPVRERLSATFTKNPLDQHGDV